MPPATAPSRHARAGAQHCNCNPPCPSGLLEPCARKPASTVLRGGRRGNAPPLPDGPDIIICGRSGGPIANSSSRAGTIAWNPPGAIIACYMFIAVLGGRYEERRVGKELRFL